MVWRMIGIILSILPPHQPSRHSRERKPSSLDGRQLIIACAGNDDMFGAIRRA